MPHALFQDTETTLVWDQRGFDAFMAKRDPMQEAVDQQRLKNLFRAASAPVTREAFNWAEKNGMKFFIDHSLQNAGAYYTMGTGVVGLGARYSNNPAIALPMLVHEIRHGWQDKQGMIPTAARSFAEYMTQIALIEADASAWQYASARQETASWHYEEGMKSPEMLPREALMGGEFTRWHNAHGTFYGETAARRMGTKLHLPDVTPVNFKTQFQPYKGKNKPPVIHGIPTALDTVIEKLGRGFDAANTDVPNYLAQPEMRAHLEKTLLSPRLAHRFFQAAAKVPPLVKEVNKAMTQKQRQHRKKHGADLYL
ncbi:MAG: hypothetical protein Q8K65_02810 [Alphaproteobacteria bacterium]|nr:hypothetical protein [Alphaproteobacteria bacterium]